MSKEVQVAKPRVEYLRNENAESPPFAHRFHTLLFLSGWKGVGSEIVRRKLGLSENKFRSLIDNLQGSYLLDVVSELQGGFIVEYLRLTDEGNLELQRMLECMCELPELQ